MHDNNPTFETIMNDATKSVEERMIYLLDEADLRHFDGPRPMDAQTYFDAVTDVYHSTFAAIKRRDITHMDRDEQMQLTRLMNTCKYLEDCLKNEGLGWLQPDRKVMREFWETHSWELYTPLQKLN